MNEAQAIDNRISELQQELETVEGTPTEVYTRIVGYYRSLKNWNRGKREEYDHRVTFQPERVAPTAGHTSVVQAFAEAAIEAASLTGPESVHELSASGREAAQRIMSYAYFFREACPNCLPVRSYVENLDLDGEMVDVDTGEGMERAVEHQILSTPTVLLKDEQGKTVAQAGTVEQLRSILETAS